jgi:hypothetical protein
MMAKLSKKVLSKANTTETALNVKRVAAAVIITDAILTEFIKSLPEEEQKEIRAKFPKLKVGIKNPALKDGVSKQAQTSR